MIHELGQVAARSIRHLDDIWHTCACKYYPGPHGRPLAFHWGLHQVTTNRITRLWFGSRAKSTAAEAMRPEFKAYAEQIIKNCQALAQSLLSRGFRLVTGGTDNHLLLVDLRSYNENLTGATAETWLHDAGIVVNKNLIPYDPRTASEPSGVRIGTPALTTRGLKEEHLCRIGQWIDQVLQSGGDAKVVSNIRNETAELCRAFPVPM